MHHKKPHKYIWLIRYILYLPPNLFWLGTYSHKGNNNAEKFSGSATRTCEFSSNIKTFHWTPLLTRSGIIRCRNSPSIKSHFQLALFEFHTKKENSGKWGNDQPVRAQQKVMLSQQNTHVLTNIIKHAFYPNTRSHLCLTHRTGSEDPEILQDTGTSGIPLQNTSLRWSTCQQCTALGHTNRMKQGRAWAKDTLELPLPELPYKIRLPQNLLAWVPRCYEEFNFKSKTKIMQFNLKMPQRHLKGS